MHKGEDNSFETFMQYFFEIIIKYAPIIPHAPIEKDFLLDNCTCKLDTHESARKRTIRFTRKIDVVTEMN